MKKFIKKFWTEFKQFAFKGNVIDLAVGMIIGSAFTAIVTELVNSILMPLLSLITGKLDFSDMFFTLWRVKIPYGQFIQAVVSFAATALCLFIIIRGINRITALAKKNEEKPAPKEPPRLCPYCYSEIHKNATRCPHCTSVLDK